MIRAVLALLAWAMAAASAAACPWHEGGYLEGPIFAQHWGEPSETPAAPPAQRFDPFARERAETAKPAQQQQQIAQAPAAGAQTPQAPSQQAPAPASAQANDAGR